MGVSGNVSHVCPEGTDWKSPRLSFPIRRGTIAESHEPEIVKCCYQLRGNENDWGFIVGESLPIYTCQAAKPPRVAAAAAAAEPRHLTTLHTDRDRNDDQTEIQTTKEMSNRDRDYRDDKAKKPERRIGQRGTEPRHYERHLKQQKIRPKTVILRRVNTAMALRRLSRGMLGTRRLQEIQRTGQD